VKIDGLSSFLTNSLQTIPELNLKEGQIIMGKIIGLAKDEAVLEIAGRALEAKVEGNPPAATGQVATFQVSKDETGRVLLKFIANVNDSGGVFPAETYLDKAPDPAVLKNIQAALRKEGTAPTPENIDKIWRGLQDFQAKYQQPLNPQVLAFIVAKKWPITPGTILTTMVFQNKETRDLLWNLLRKSLPEKEFNEFISKYAMVPHQAGPEGLAGKMAAFRDIKSLQDLLGQLFNLSAGENPEENQDIQNTQAKANLKNMLTPTELKAEPKTGLKTAPEAGTLATRAAETMRPEAKQGSPINKEDPILSMRGRGIDSPDMPDKSSVVVESKTLGMAGKLGRAEQQKIAAVLEQHITLSKSVPANEPASMPNYSIPFLINDPKTGLQEFLVKWRQESNHSKNENTGQLIFISIPTANMGDINLSLRVTDAGTGINLKVNTNEIRQYLLNHLAELKKTIVDPGNAGHPTPSIVVGLKEPETVAGMDMRFDLWM
jgi:hypothetical protein